MASASPRHLALVVLVLSISLRCTATVTVPVEEACRHTTDPSYCAKALSAKPESKTAAGLEALAELSVSLAEKSVAQTVSFMKNLEKIPGGVPAECLDECVRMFRAAVAELKRSKAALLKHRDVSHVKGWVSAARLDGETCMNDCKKEEGGADPDIAGNIAELGKLYSIALDLTHAGVRS